MEKLEPHKFGGYWTKQKLEVLKDYLSSYMTIFTQNPAAQKLYPYYIDAFAGTGHWTAKKSNNPTWHVSLLEGFEDVHTLQEGSVKVALEQDPPFYKYVFIDIDPHHVQTLHSLVTEYRHLHDRIEIYQDDANQFIKMWCSKMQTMDRAVLFLDPYGASIEWETIKAIAQTKSIDLWLLFPLGSAINRMLPRIKLPNDGFSKKLTSIFGTDEWKDIFYDKGSQLTLPGIPKKENKSVHIDQIGDYFIQRLKTVFEGVAQPKPLYNSRNNPLYLLCFAAGNPKGKTPALRIADYLLKRM